MSDFPTPYRRYDVLSKWSTVSWNDVTRDVVQRRLRDVPPRRYLRDDEWATLQAAANRIVPQPDRRDDPVPIAAWIDRKLHENITDGYRYEDMPPMREAWRQGLAGIEHEAQQRHGRAFPSLSAGEQDAILRAIQHGEVGGGPWDRLPARKFFKATLLREIVVAYYAHPAAWSECGFGGPASPRGYVRLEAGRRDPWEAKAEHDR